jgi:hypothetical protein
MQGENFHGPDDIYREMVSMSTDYQWEKATVQAQSAASLVVFQRGTGRPVLLYIHFVPTAPEWAQIRLSYGFLGSIRALMARSFSGRYAMWL